MFRLSIFISVLLTSFFLFYSESIASNYIPWATIAMTGSNSSVRFDIASDLYNNGASATAPALTTANAKFTGAFYGSGIGWIEFSTGTYQVSLNCGAQPLDNLSSNCTLSGTGWSENVWDIYFSSGNTITYNPNTGYLSGSAITFVWNIDLTGIALPLRPVTINESDIVANHAMNITVSGASIYGGGNGAWNMELSPMSSANTRISAWNYGIFSVDLSLATTYSIIITDTNGSTTKFSLLVTPCIPTTTRIPGKYADTFCAANASDSARCPDGASRISSSLDKSIVGLSVIANASDTYTLTMKTRDTYGNRVSTGDIAISYTTTVKNIQSDISENPNYGPSIDGDAFFSAELLSGLGGSVAKTISLWAWDITYHIASSAPTNTTDNIIKLDSINYKSGSTSTPITPTNISLTLKFDPLFTVSINSIDSPVLDQPYVFSGVITKNDPTSGIVPTIITTLKVGAGMSSAWTGMISDPGALCTKYHMQGSVDPLCDWDDVSSLAVSATSGFTFTGTYTSIVWFTPPTESTTIGTYIYYNSGTETLYRLPDKIVNDPTFTIPRLRILGQASIGLGTQNRINIINSLREKISLLSRNRANYNNTDFVIYTGNQSITDATFSDKRTIIVIGGDITISSNISIHDHPLAIIALIDTNNIGGNIIIDWAVTDIHSTLIAEHSITSPVSTSQLYIHGSMISSNPPQEAIPTSCPYFDSGCTPADYDLPGARSEYTISSLSWSSNHNPLVIEYDTRLIGDPPPAMSK